MADTTLTGPAHHVPDAVPAFPMQREPRCPFDPPPALEALQEQGPLTRVRLWDGSEPWLVTRCAEQRALLGDPRVSADTDQPGCPTKASPEGHALRLLAEDPPVTTVAHCRGRSSASVVIDVFRGPVGTRPEPTTAAPSRAGDDRGGCRAVIYPPVASGGRSP
jgi:hypothetical protein